MMTGFEFGSMKEKEIEGRKLIIFKALNIPIIYGSCKDAYGNYFAIKNFKGNIFMDIGNLNDITLTTDGSKYLFQGIRKKGEKSIYPKQGFYRELLKSDLIVDINLQGKVWLTRIPFNIPFLSDQQKQLEEKIRDMQEQLEELKGEIETAEH